MAYAKGYIPYNKGKSLGGGWNKNLSGYTNCGSFKKGITPWNKGRKMTAGEKISRKIRGENNGSWKGNNVKYAALHHWIYKRLGQPNYCEMCKKTDRLAYHWANKSGKYKRDINDWLRLCVSCHKEYDKERE